MDEHSTPTDDGIPSFARSLSAGLEVRSTDFLDGWWLHEAARADHTEFTYAMRHTALGELEPTTLEGLLPEGAEVVRRVFYTLAKKQELVVAYEEALAAMTVDASYVWLAVAARDAKHAAYVKDTLLDAFPEGEEVPAGEAKVPLFVWTAGRSALQDGGRLNAAQGRAVGGDPRQLRARDRRRARRALRRVRAREGREPPAVARRPRHGEVARARGARARVALVVRDPLRGRPRGPARRLRLPAVGDAAAGQAPARVEARHPRGHGGAAHRRRVGAHGPRALSPAQHHRRDARPGLEDALPHHDERAARELPRGGREARAGAPRRWSSSRCRPPRGPRG